MKRLVTYAALAALALALPVGGTALARPSRPLPVDPRPVDPAPAPDVDAGSEDGGMDVDAGEPLDAASPSDDAGPSEIDAGEVPDASIPMADAGDSDLGTVPAHDGGALIPDATTPADGASVDYGATGGPDVFNSEPSGGACNCDAAGARTQAPWIFAMLGAIVFALRHRRKAR